MIISRGLNQNPGDHIRETEICKHCKSSDMECIPSGAFVKRFLLRMPFGRLIDHHCLRKQITLIQIFAAFPFCGIIIPNVIFSLIGPTYSIPLLQLLIGCCLFFIIISSFAVQLLYSKRKPGNRDSVTPAYQR